MHVQECMYQPESCTGNVKFTGICTDVNGEVDVTKRCACAEPVPLCEVWCEPLLLVQTDKSEARNLKGL